MEEDSEESDEAAKEAVVEEAPVEEDLNEEIVEGEADVQVTFVGLDGATVSIGDEELTPKDGEDTAEYTMDTADDLEFTVEAKDHYRVTGVTAAFDDADTNTDGITVTESEDTAGTYTYTISTTDAEVDNDISANFTVTIATVQLHDVTVGFEDDAVASFTVAEEGEDENTGDKNKATIQAPEGAIVKLSSIVVADGYQLVKVTDAAGEEITKGEDNSYALTVAATDDTTENNIFNIVTAKLTFPVSVTFPDNAADIVWSVGDAAATAEETGKVDTVEYDSSLTITFTVPKGWTADATFGDSSTYTEGTLEKDSDQNDTPEDRVSYTLTYANIQKEISTTVTSEIETFAFSVKANESNGTNIKDLNYTVDGAVQSAMPSEVNYGAKVVVTFNAPASHKVTDPSAGKLTEGATTGEGEDKTTAYTLTFEKVTAAVSVTLSSAEEKYTITESVDDAKLKEDDNSKKIVYAEDTVTEESNENKLLKGTDLVFTVTPKADNFIRTIEVKETTGSKVLAGTAETDAETGAVTYTVPASLIRANIKITVTTGASDKQTKQPITVIRKTNADAPVVFETGEYNGNIFGGEDIKFTVKNDPEKDKKIKVSWLADNAEEGTAPTELTASGDAYTIGQSALTDAKLGETDGITIFVTTVYEVTFTELTGVSVSVNDIGENDPAKWTEAEENKEIEVEKDASLSFVVTKDDKAFKLRYVKVTKDGETDATDLVEKDIYTLTPTEDLSVAVKATKRADVTVTFAQTQDAWSADKENVGLVKLVTPTLSGNDITKEIKDEDISTGVVVPEDSKLLFSVSANDIKDKDGNVTQKNVYKVDKVTVPGAEADSDPVELTPVNKAENQNDYEVAFTDTEDARKTVTITSVLDEAKASTLSLAVTGGSTVSYTAEITAESLVDQEYIGHNDFAPAREDEPYRAGDKILTKNTKAQITLTAGTGYQIDTGAVTYRLGDVFKPVSDNDIVNDPDADAVKAGDKVGEVTLAIDLANGTPAVLTVATVPEALTRNENFVLRFNNRSDNMAVTVETSDYVVEKKEPVDLYQATTSALSAGKSDYFFDVLKGATEIKFTVTPVAPYTPVVNAYEDEGLAIAKVPADTAYTYTVSAKALFEAASSDLLLKKYATINIDEDVFKHTATIKGDGGVEDITAWANGKKVTPNDKFEYTFNGGSTLLVTVTPKAGYAADKAVTTLNDVEGDKGTETEIKNNTFEIKAKEKAEDSNTTTEVSTKAIYVAAPLKDKAGEDVESANGVYMVDAAEYTAAAKLGNADVTFKADASTVTAGKAKAETTVEVSGTKATIKVAPADAGKTLTVTLYTEVDAPAAQADETAPAKQTVPAATYVLAVSPDLKSVKIDGVKSGKLTQTIDTEKTYKITATPNTVKLSGLALEIADKDKDNVIANDDTAGIITVNENGTFTIRTHTGKEGKSVLVKVFDIAKSTDKEKAYVTGGEFTLVTAAPAAFNGSNKPTVKFDAATDTTLKLTLGLPKGTEIPVKGDLYYAVKVTPADGAPAEAKVKPAFTEYVQVALDKDAGTMQASQKADIRVFADDVAEGKGQAWDFAVEVTLVQTCKENADVKTAADADKFTSAAVTLAKASTRNPYYEDNLKLKKKATTIYTGQTDVEVAEAAFGKNTSYLTIVEVNDITKGLADNRKLKTPGAQHPEKVVVSTVPELNNNTNDSPTALGKHTIEVIAVAENGMYQARTTLVVNVVRGIEELHFVAPAADSIYKKANAAASVKLVPGYNWNYSIYAPKTKKVTWELYKVDTTDDGIEDVLITKDSPLSKLVSVSNGTVKVDKKYVVSANPDDNVFKVVAKAADYKESTIQAEQTITITDKAQELGTPILVKYYTDGPAAAKNYYKILDTTAPLTVRELNGAELVVLEKGAKLDSKAFYNYNDIYEYEVTAPLTYKSSSKAALDVHVDGSLDAIKPAKNITLTATTTDGSKNAVQLKGVTIAYEAMDLGLQISRVDEYGFEEYNDNKFASDDETDTNTKLSYAYDTKTINYTGIKDTAFVVSVGAMFDNGTKALGIKNTEAQYTVAIKGAKTLDKSKLGNYYLIQPTAQTVTIKLTNKTTGAVKDYTLTNSVNLSRLPAAPKVTMVAPNNALKAGYITSYQPIDYSFTSKTYDAAGKHLMITVDPKTKEVYGKTWDAYQAIMDASGTIHRNPLHLTGNGMRDTFEPSYIPAGSYKLNFTFGHIGTNGEFVPETKPAAVTLKAVAPKKASFKPTTGYKLSAADNYTAKLDGKATGDNVVVTWGTDTDTVTGVLNANVKGQPNAFNKLFAVEPKTDDYGNIIGYYLKLNTPKTPEEKAEFDRLLADKSNLTGYIRYTAEDTRNSFKVSDFAKVTVTLVPTTDKYALSAATALLNTKGKTTAVVEFSKKLKKGTAPVTVAYAIPADEAPVFTAKADGSPYITLEAANAEVKKYTVNLMVVPTGSYYADEINKAAEADRAGLINKYGIKVPATVTVTDKSDKLIDVKAKELEKSFVKENYTQRAQDGTYQGTYNAASAFTKLVQCDIEAVKITPAADASAEVKAELTALEKALTLAAAETTTGVNGSIVAQLKKNAFEIEADAGTLAYGAKVTVPVTITFAGGYTQTETMTYTLPKEKAQTFNEAVDAVRNYDWSKVVITCDDTGIDVWDATNKVARALDNLKWSGKISPLSDMAFGTWWTFENGYQEPADITVTPGQDKNEATAEFKLTNLSDNQETEVTVGPMTILPENTFPQYVIDAVEAAATDLTDNASYDSADVTYAKVAADVRAAVNAQLAKNEKAEEQKLPANLRIRLGYLIRTDATEGTIGSVMASIELYDHKNMYQCNEFQNDSNHFTITVKAIQNVSALTAQNGDIDKAVAAAIMNGELNAPSADSILAVVKRAVSNPSIIIEWKTVDKPVTPPTDDTAKAAAADTVKEPDLTVTAPTADTKGSFYGTLNVYANAEDYEDNNPTKMELGTKDVPFIIPETGAAAVKTAAAAVLIGDRVKELAKTAQDENAVLTALATEANKALSDDAKTKYEVKANDNKLLTAVYGESKAEKATADEAGYVKAVLVVMHKAQTDPQAGAYPVAVITVDETLAADPSLQTLDELNTALTDNSKKLFTDLADKLGGEAFVKGAEADTVAAIEAAMAALIVNPAIKATVKEQTEGSGEAAKTYKLKLTTEPTLNQAGSASCKIELTQTVPEGATAVTPKVIDVTFTPAALKQTQDEAKAAAEAAVTKLGTIYADPTKDKVEEAINAAVTEAIKNTYKAELRNASYTKAKDKTADAEPVDGKYTATLVISYDSGVPSRIVYANVSVTLKYDAKPAETPAPTPES